MLRTHSTRGTVDLELDESCMSRCSSWDNSLKEGEGQWPRSYNPLDCFQDKCAPDACHSYMKEDELVVDYLVSKITSPSHSLFEKECAAQILGKIGSNRTCSFGASPLTLPSPPSLLPLPLPLPLSSPLLCALHFYWLPISHCRQPTRYWRSRLNAGARIGNATQQQRPKRRRLVFDRHVLDGSR